MKNLQYEQIFFFLNASGNGANSRIEETEMNGYMLAFLLKSVVYFLAWIGAEFRE
jgi:hypothetical protein